MNTRRLFQPEDGGSEILRNIVILLQHYTTSQDRTPWDESSPPWKPKISHKTVPCLSLRKFNDAVSHEKFI